MLFDITFCESRSSWAGNFFASSFDVVCCSHKKKKDETQWKERRRRRNVEMTWYLRFLFQHWLKSFVYSVMDFRFFFFFTFSCVFFSGDILFCQPLSWHLISLLPGTFTRPSKHSLILNAWISIPLHLED